jgi:hypothetical protein
MARRRRIDILEAGIDYLFSKWLGGFFGGLLATLAKKALARLKEELVKWLSDKWISDDLDGFPEEDEADLLP